jgi:hypothetical protein
VYELASIYPPEGVLWQHRANLVLFELLHQEGATSTLLIAEPPGKFRFCLSYLMTGVLALSFKRAVNCALLFS